MVLIFRKLYRLCGIIFPLIYFFGNKRTTLFWLTLTTFLFLILEIIRFFFPQFNRQIFKSLKVILKEEESGKRFSATTCFLLGSLLTVFLFSKEIAIASLFFLIFGDAVSALVGVKWGRVKIGSKTLEGSLAFLAVCFLIGLMLKNTYLGLDIKVSFSGALAATLMELMPLPVNDNFSIPLSAAIVMAIFR